MKQKKIGTTLYVFSEDPYVITEDTDAKIIYVQQECINDFKLLNVTLTDKILPINYHSICIKHPEWADYYNDFTVYVEQTTGGTVTAYPTSGDEGEEIQVSHLASERYDFDHWNILDEDGNDIEVKNGKFLMPASNVTVSAVFKINYNTQFLTIESEVDNNTISWKTSKASSTQYIQCSTDKINWTTVRSNTSGALLATLNNGDKLYLKGSLIGHSSTPNYDYISSTQEFKLYGNIMSLTDGDNFINATTLTKTKQLSDLFKGSKVTDASNLILPATTLSRNCYTSMFTGCTSLVTAPELPATTLVQECYSNMFWGCTSLTTAPTLPATTLAQNCYFYMFTNCTSLNNITMLATNISALNCLDNWVSNVAATGTFTKSASMTTLPTGQNGIPTGWTVQDA